MTLIITLLARLGLSQRVARAWAPFAAAGLAVALLAALWAGFQLWDWWDDRQAVKAAEVKREARAGEARETAADERLADALADQEHEEELHDAIHDAHDDGAPSPAARALACERLRRIGRIPPACRPAGGDGSQAAPD